MYGYKDPTEHELKSDIQFMKIILKGNSVESVDEEKLINLGFDAKLEVVLVAIS